MTFEELEEEFHEGLNGGVTSMRQQEFDLLVDLEFDHWSSRKRVCATVCCEGMVESTLRTGEIGWIRRQNDHPLLWKQTEPVDSIFFASPAFNPFELLGHLYDVHRRLFEGYRCTDYDFQTDAVVLTASSGILAKGPRSAMLAYQTAASPYMRCSILHGPERDHSAWHLIFFDESYIICQNLKVLRPS